MNQDLQYLREHIEKEVLAGPESVLIDGIDGMESGNSI